MFKLEGTISPEVNQPQPIFRQFGHIDPKSAEGQSLTEVIKNNNRTVELIIEPWQTSQSYAAEGGISQSYLSRVQHDIDYFTSRLDCDPASTPPLLVIDSGEAMIDKDLFLRQSHPGFRRQCYFIPSISNYNLMPTMPIDYSLSDPAENELEYSRLFINHLKSFRVEKLILGSSYVPYDILTRYEEPEERLGCLVSLGDFSYHLRGGFGKTLARISKARIQPILNPELCHPLDNKVIDQINQTTASDFARWRKYH